MKRAPAPVKEKPQPKTKTTSGRAPARAGAKPPPASQPARAKPAVKAAQLKAKPALKTAKLKAVQTKTLKAAKKAPARAPRRPAARADLGAPIAGFFEKQPPALRAILDQLRQLVEEVVPRAAAAIKWGNPFYSLAGETVCAFSAHKSHVNLILAGPPGTFSDPRGRLTGEGKTGRHLKLMSLDQLPQDEVRAWLLAAAAHAAH